MAWRKMAWWKPAWEKRAWRERAWREMASRWRKIKILTSNASNSMASYMFNSRFHTWECAVGNARRNRNVLLKSRATVKQTETRISTSKRHHFQAPTARRHENIFIIRAVQPSSYFKVELLLPGVLSTSAL
jgi:hypothetical protein